jgi:hypothetical protein
VIVSRAVQSDSTFRVRVPPPATAVTPLASRPTFSVIIGVYQGAHLIGGALESLATQTLRPDETVVCDDGSTDDLDAALEPYRQDITLVRKENGGFASALNAAVQMATGDFVVILDSDDAYLPRRLEAIAYLATIRPDLDVIGTDAVLEVDGEPLARYYDLHRFPVDADDQRREMIRQGFVVVPAIRRRALAAIGGFDESLRIGEDWDCCIRLVLAGCLIGIVDEPLYRYRLRPDSLSASQAGNRRANVAILEKLMGHPALTDAERTVVAEGVRHHRRRAAHYEAKEAILQGRPDARRNSLRIALGRGYPLVSRGKAAVSALAPGLARRVLERQLAASPTRGIELEHR